MTTVNIHSAKTQLSRLLKKAQSGEEVIIASAGKPIARLVPIKPPKRREAGLWRRKYPHMMPELDKLIELVEQPLPEDELARWEK